MEVVELSKTEVRKRQRASIASGPLNELKGSIVKTGLLHPPVYWFDDSTQTWVLTAGERRTRAIAELAKEKVSFYCGGTLIAPGQIPILPLGEYLDATGRFEAELDENIHRVDLEWPERAQAFADLHSMRLRQNPRQTPTDTGRELVSKSTEFTNPKAAAEVIRESQLIAENLHDPKIAAARNHREAVQLIYKREEEKVLAALTKRQLAKSPSLKDIEIRNGDLFTILPALDSGIADLICADPPYGIGADAGGFRQRTVHHHNYKDDIVGARLVAESILTEGFRITKSRANVFIFCDIDLFAWLKDSAANMGWTPFRRPLIWQKSESEGMAPWGGSGPRITTEFIFYATKGRRGMITSPTDVFNIKRVSRVERTHGAEKPVELLKELIRVTTLPGDLVIDPCCGSGSTIVACRELGRRGLGIEKDLDHYNTALANLHSGGTNAGATT